MKIYKDEKIVKELKEFVLKKVKMFIYLEKMRLL